MNNTALILGALNLALQYSPQLVADFIALFHGNPLKPNETIPQYVARLNAETIALDANVQAQNAAIQDQSTVPPIVQAPTNT